MNDYLSPETAWIDKLCSWINSELIKKSNHVTSIVLRNKYYKIDTYVVGIIHSCGYITIFLKNGLFLDILAGNYFKISFNDHHDSCCTLSFNDKTFLYFYDADNYFEKQSKISLHNKKKLIVDRLLYQKTKTISIEFCSLQHFVDQTDMYFFCTIVDFLRNKMIVNDMGEFSARVFVQQKNIRYLPQTLGALSGKQIELIFNELKSSIVSLKKLFISHEVDHLSNYNIINHLNNTDGV